MIKIIYCIIFCKVKDRYGPLCRKSYPLGHFTENVSWDHFPDMKYTRLPDELYLESPNFLSMTFYDQN